MKESQMAQVAEWMIRAMRSPTDEHALRAIHEEVRALCKRFPVPGLD
jgi:glycine/serine hydroxymethyltransferase